MARFGSLPTFEKHAAARLAARRRAEDARIAAEGLPDLGNYIHKLSPMYQPPRHLQPMLDHIENYETKPFELVFSVPPRHGKPLVGSTPVRMADGTQRPIRALTPGMRVVSGTGRATTVTGVYAQGFLPVWEVRTSSGAHFLAEGSHRFLTGRGWRRVDELRPRPARRADVLVRAVGHVLDAPGRVVPVETDFRPWGERLPAGTWVPEKVVSVRRAGVAPCYCITVAQDESFLVTAQDFVTHNTETLLHMVPWVLRKHPDWRVIYCTYSMSLARDKALKVRRLCHEAGVSMATTKVTDWQTGIADGGFTATGIGGMLTGKGANILIIDDPTKDRATAESRIYRDKTWDWFTSTAYTRRLKGASVIVCGTRWHVDDLQGRLIRGDANDGRQPWACVNLPALADDYEEAARLGREPDSALWPEMFDVKELRKILATLGPYEWASLYQGRPQPRGGSIFGDPYFYDELPGGSYRIAVGMDLAYTDDTKRDYSVAVVGYYYPELDKIHVVRVLRRQMAAQLWKEYVHEELKELCEHGAAGWRFYGSGTEIVAGQLMRQMPSALPLHLVAATKSKLIRATRYSQAWNEGKVVLPAPYRQPSKDVDDGAWDDNPAYDDMVETAAQNALEAQRRQEEKALVEKRRGWVSAFVQEHLDFTGNKQGETDDQVDAGAAMHDVLRPPRYEDQSTGGTGPITGGRWRR